MPRKNSIGCIACACMHISLIFQLRLSSKNVRSSGGGGIKFIFGAARKHLRYMSTTVGGAARLSFFVHFFPVKQTMSSGMGHRLKYQ